MQGMYGSCAPTPLVLELHSAKQARWVSSSTKVAVGTGAGLRYDLSFLVVRFDVGVGLHFPYKTTRSGWYNIPSFRDALGFHLAIGYPF